MWCFDNNKWFTNECMNFTLSLEIALAASMSPHASLHQRSKPLSCDTWEGGTQYRVKIHCPHSAVTDLLDLRMTSDDGDLPSSPPHWPRDLALSSHLAQPRPPPWSVSMMMSTSGVGGWCRVCSAMSGRGFIQRDTPATWNCQLPGNNKTKYLRLRQMS